MAKYYFTYGAGKDSGHPFRGGWTEVEAESMERAIQLFQKVHKGENGRLRCCAVYPEEEMKRTQMFLIGNFKKRCVETIREDGKNLAIWRAYGEG